jgi:hypothetical protein
MSACAHGEGPDDPGAEAIEALVADFLARRLPRHCWTHRAHLAVGLWMVHRHGEAGALARLRQQIRSHNEAVGIANDAGGGYHETLTRLWIHAIAVHHAAHPRASLADSFTLLLHSPLASPHWPQRHYSPERLFSDEARAAWLEPDRAPLVW